ncbi:MAG: spermidine/putrescine ABC transporter substrate-binding protein [Victivallales bacterium]|nr:spermidine/putrescine ABC transporter substrate-binding protein [Victivallales bacterium]
MAKKCWLAVIFALCAFTMVGCNRNHADGGNGARKKVLHVYIWCDYISPEVIHKFEKQYNCRVQQDIFDSNETMLAKLQAGGTGYDVLCPSHYLINKMVATNLVVKLDKSKLPNLSHLDETVTEKLDSFILDYAVPYFVSYTGIGYNKQEVKNFEPSWDIFSRTDLKNRMTLLDDHSEIIGAAAKHLGYTAAELDDPVNGDAKMDEVVKLALKWRKNIIKFDNEQYKNGLATGEFLVVMGYFSDLSQIVEENEELALAMPPEGCMMSCDMLVISPDAKEPELAYAFINFLHDPENAAQNITDVCAYCPNRDAIPLLDDEVLANDAIFLDESILSRSEFMPELSPEQEERHLDYWQKIRAGDASK